MPEYKGNRYTTEEKIHILREADSDRSILVRHGQGATLLTSQFPVHQWRELINDTTVADAILDRLVHNGDRIELKGESLRKAKGGLHAKDRAGRD